MGRKGRWYDAVQRILSTSEPDHEEQEARVESTKAEKPTEKSRIKKILQFNKSDDPSDSSSSVAPRAAPPPAAHHHRHPSPPPSRPDHQPQQAECIKEAKSTQTRNERSSHGGSSAALGASIGAKATAVAVQTAAAVARLTAATPRAPARSKEELAAIKIQTACRGHWARIGHQARGMARLMSLVDGVAVRRQTDEILYCTQTMTRVQTQIYLRRVKAEEDKKALKNQIHVNVVQGLDKAKVGEGWDHSHQSKEQMEAVIAMKQEAASRRQRALAYAFSHQWRNRNHSSARAAPPPMFMDPGNPNWGWSWTERWLAAARPWESQTAVESGRAPAKISAGRAGVAAISVQIPTTPGRSAFRPPNCPSPSTPTPTPRSPYVLGRAVAAAPPPASPRSSPLHRSAAGGLRRTTSLHSERPRSSQERPASGGALHGGKEASALRRTASLRSGEIPRRLSLGGAGPGNDAGEAPVTPSYMQPTKSVSAKARPVAAADKVELHERAPQVSSPSVKKRLSLALADKPTVSSPSKAKAERGRRHSQPPSPRLL